MSPNAVDRVDAAARAQRDRLRALIDAAARDVRVLRLERARHLVDRQVLGAQQLGVEPDVDLALRPPITTTWPTPSALSSQRRSPLSANSVMSRSGLSAVTATVSTGEAVGSSFSTIGCVTVRGSSGSTRLTRSRTSWAATSAFFSSLKDDHRPARCPQTRWT